MATKVDHMLEEALALPADDRARLAAKLLASLPGKPPGRAAQAARPSRAGRGRVGGRLYSHARASARRMALGGPLAGARLIALDTSAFIYLIEKNPAFFPAVEPIFQAIDAGAVQAMTSVLTLLEVLVKPLEANAVTLADDFRAALAASANLRVVDVDRSVAEQSARIRATYGYRTPDAIHLATAQLAGAEAFVTNDDKLRSFSGVPVVSLRALMAP